MQNQNIIWKNIQNHNRRVKKKFFKRKIKINEVEKTLFKNSKSQQQINFLKKKRGRKKIDDSDNNILIVKHDRNSDDNLKRKVKTHFHNYIIALLNSKLQLEPGKEKLKFVKINSEITQDITIEYNQKLFKKAIKDIIVQTSEKYQNKDINRECINYIMNTKSINYEIINLLNMTYEDMYLNYYLKSTKDSFDFEPNESYESHKEKLKKFGNEYLKGYIKNAENLINFYATSKKRQSKKRKNEENENSFNQRYFKRRESKITTDLLSKRSSFQYDNNSSFTFYNQIKNEEKRRSSKNIFMPIHPLDKTTIRGKKSLKISNNKFGPLSALYSNKNSVVEHSFIKTKSVNLANSESFLDMKYFADKKFKHTILQKGKLNLHVHKNMHSSSLFERLKESYLYEKSEATLFKIKICYGFLAIFSLLSILLEVTDVILFNRKSEEFLKENYNIYLKEDTNINDYYFIQKRKISKKENAIRVFNLIFSIISFFMHLIIHFIQYRFDRHSDDRDRYNSYYGYKRHKKSSRHQAKDSNNNPNDNHIKFIFNDNLVTKNFVSKREIFKLVLNCVISGTFYPPGLNKVFIGINDKVIYVYSLNIFFLLITFFKLKNLYFAIHYLSPYNNLLYKTICSSNMAQLNFKFTIRFLLNNFPMSFIIINFLVIGLVTCILLYTIEHFSINIQYGIWNNIGDNDPTNFYNQISLYCLFIFKYIHGNIKPETIFGSFILLIGGTIGLFLSSYLLYCIHNLMEFTSEEQQAYSKLVKLLNPLNNENKSANLVKVFIQLNKLYLDNQIIKDNYRKMKEDKIKAIVEKTFGIRKSNFNFDPNDRSNSLSNIAETNDYKEKKKFLKYLCTLFVLKIKFLNEIKNFKNNLIIARNNTLSLNDVLKTLGDKMNGNINQLNNKIEKLIKNDKKFKNFMRFQENTLKKVQTIMTYEEFLLHYLIEKNNNNELSYYKDKKEMQNNFLNKYKNEGGGVKRLKSSFNGPFLSFKKKPTNKNIITDTAIINIEKQKEENLKGLIDCHNINKKESIHVKKLRSSILGNNNKFMNKLDLNRSKTNPIKNALIDKKKNVQKNKNLNQKKVIIKSKSIDIRILKNKIFDSNYIIPKKNEKKRSIPNKCQIIDEFKNKI